MCACKRVARKKDERDGLTDLLKGGHISNRSSQVHEVGRERRRESDRPTVAPRPVRLSGFGIGEGGEHKGVREMKEFACGMDGVLADGPELSCQDHLPLIISKYHSSGTEQALFRLANSDPQKGCVYCSCPSLNAAQQAMSCDESALSRTRKPAPEVMKWVANPIH